MSFLDYINENTEGLALIDRLRNAIKNLCHDDIKNEFKEVTEDDIDKLTLFIENSLIECLKNYDGDFETISLEYVTNTIGGLVGFHRLLNGIDKNRRESYLEILWDVICESFSSVDDIDKLCELSYVVNKYVMINAGEYDGDYSDCLCEKDMQECLSEIYKYILKDKLDF